MLSFITSENDYRVSRYSPFSHHLVNKCVFCPLNFNFLFALSSISSLLSSFYLSPLLQILSVAIFIFIFHFLMISSFCFLSFKSTQRMIVFFTVSVSSHDYNFVFFPSKLQSITQCFHSLSSLFNLLLPLSSFYIFIIFTFSFLPPAGSVQHQGQDMVQFTPGGSGEHQRLYRRPSRWGCGCEVRHSGEPRGTYGFTLSSLRQVNSLTVFTFLFIYYLFIYFV